MAVKGEYKLKARVPIAWALSAAGAALLVVLLLVLNAYLAPLYTILLGAVIAFPLLLQGPVSLPSARQYKTLLEFLERCGPDSQIASAAPLTFYSYFLKIKARYKDQWFEFGYGYWAIPLPRRPPNIRMVFPTKRQGISYQNLVRFNNFSKKYNTTEYTFLKGWHVRLFLYPKKPYWWFDLMIYRGETASERHLYEAFTIAAETKINLEGPNPPF